MEQTDRAIFENHSTYTLPVLTEAYKATLKKSYLIYHWVFIGIFGCLTLYHFIKFFMLHHLLNCLLGAEFLIGTILLTVLYLYMPKRLGKRQYKTNHTLYHGQDVQAHTQFFETGIQNTNAQSGGSLQWEYAKISKCVETRNLFIMIIDNTAMIVLDKNRFTGYSPANFRALVRQKCPNAKLKFRL